jgi:hypothetical protein
MTTTAVRRVAAYGGALAITPYLLIKLSWVVGALAGVVPVDRGFSLAGWVALNTVTIGMAAGGVLLALALARPRGRRVPVRPVLVLGWFGTGFLVPLLPYLVASPFVVPDDGSPAMPAWESALFTGGLAGFAVGIAVALPLYLLEDRPGLLRTLAPVNRATATVATAGSAAVGVLTAWWALGGTAGLEHPGSRETGWYFLTATTAVVALAGAAATAALALRPPGTWRWLAVAAAWTSSGMLTAWSLWKLPLVAVLATNPAVTEVPWPEDLRVAAGQYVLGAVGGVAMLLTLRRAASGASAGESPGAPAGRSAGGGLQRPAGGPAAGRALDAGVAVDGLGALRDADLADPQPVTPGDDVHVAVVPVAERAGDVPVAGVAERREVGARHGRLLFGSLATTASYDASTASSSSSSGMPAPIRSEFQPNRPM